MKLFCSPTSPYVRIARVAWRAKGISPAPEEVMLNPYLDPPELLAANPLGKVPTLVLDNGQSVCGGDSILDYFDYIDGKPTLHDRSDASSANAIALARSLGDGLIDQLVNVILEKRRPPEEQSASMIERWKEKALRCIMAFENIVPTLPTDRLCAGKISLICALGTVDFREIVQWRDSNPELAQWYDRASDHEVFAATVQVLP